MTATGERLIDRYDLVILDLDGVVYLIDQPIPGAVEAIARLERDGPTVAYATNNASRRPAGITAMLTGMGVPATESQVFTSARAAAEVLAERFAPETPVLVVGTQALSAEMHRAGLAPVRHADAGARAVVQGYGQDVCWSDLAEASLAVRAGALWVATNSDLTMPSGRGPLPGNGSLVAAVAAALGREPDVVVGKPEPALLRLATRAASARRPLVVGDRLDTDIEGARRAGMDSLLVLTGVTAGRDLLTAPASRRPTYLAADLGALFDPARDAAVAEQAAPDAELAGWRVRAGGVLDGSGREVDALRLLCGLAWAGTDPATLRAGGDAAAKVIDELGMPA